jgi:HEAT repeat protein
MQRVLVVAILAVAIAFLALTIGIVAGKAWREIRDARRRRRRNALEPIVLGFAHGDAPSILPALGGGVARRDRPVLEAILLDHVQRVRGVERDRLGRILDELGFVESYLAGLSSPRWWIRARAAEHLGLARAKRATPHLLRALDDDSYDVRLRAAKAVAAAGGTAAVAPLAKALSEPNRFSTIRIADILAGMGHPVVRELVDVFPHLTRHGKLAVLDILGRIHPPEAVPWLHERLQEPHRDLRARAAHAIGAIGATASAGVLRAALEDPDWPVRAMAAKGLGRLHDEEAIPQLCAAMRDREWWVRANAGEALRRIGPPGIAALENMLDDEDRYAQHQACLVLESAGVLERRVVELVTPGPAGERAAVLVQRFIRMGQTARLCELAATHRDPVVRGTIARLLPLSGAPQEVAR